MDITGSITSQYLAALEMLKQAVVLCPELLWNSADDKNKFWHIAYHALFFTHLYLHESLKTFKPWPGHRPEYENLGPLPWPPHDMPKIGEPYDRAALLEFVAFCQQEVMGKVPRFDLQAPAGFDWLPFNRLELHLYNIRHLQQHTGELMERLGTRASIEFGWVIRAPTASASV
jgi:hypothetical protein